MLRKLNCFLICLDKSAFLTTKTRPTEKLKRPKELRKLPLHSLSVHMQVFNERISTRISRNSMETSVKSS